MSIVPDRLRDMNVDYSKKSYDEWLQFAVNSTDEQHGDVEIDPVEPLVLVEYFERSCMNMHDLLGQYSWPQIDRFIWNSLANPFWIGHIVTDPILPVAPRDSCIDSMYFPFKQVLGQMPDSDDEENGFYMWWDIVCGGFCTQHVYFETHPFVPDSAESCKIHDKLLDTLRRILKIPEKRTQMCALHGLGHLHHPQGAEIVQKYIDDHKTDFDDAGFQWLCECRDGTVM